MDIIITVASLVSWLAPTTKPSVEGKIKYYDKGVMEAVAVNRGYISHKSEYDDWLKEQGIDGGAALMRRGDLGRSFTILWSNGTATRHIAIDCADFKDFKRRKGDVAEVDWAVAQQKEMRGPVEGKIVFDSPIWGKYKPN